MTRVSRQAESRGKGLVAGAAVSGIAGAGAAVSGTAGARTAGAERIVCFAPFVPPAAKVLILGSMPSVKSLEQQFYYAHPRNRFFKLIGHYLALKRGMSSGLVVPLPTISERQAALTELGIALYDVIHSCVRAGSLDSAIKDYEYSDILGLLAAHSQIKTVITNGSFAATHFRRSTLQPLIRQHELKLNQWKTASSLELVTPALSFHFFALPSTSPANAVAWEKLRDLYDCVLLPILGLQEK